MAGVLDLDAIEVATTDIKKTINGKLRVWALRDNVPPEIMLQCFRMLSHAEIQGQAIAALRQQTDDGDAEQIEAAIELVYQKLLAQQDEVTHICGEIFRFTFRETTDDDIRAWFGTEDRTRIVQLFFTRQLRASSQLSSDTTPTPTPNRQQRRTNSRRSSGAIPSQRRLSRELKSLM